MVVPVDGHDEPAVVQLDLEAVGPEQPDQRGPSGAPLGEHRQAGRPPSSSSRVGPW